MGLFSKLLVGMVGFYAGVYCDQNYKLPSVSEPAQLLDEINKMLEEYKNGKSKWRGIPPLSADISPQFQPQISPRMQVWGDWGRTEKATFVFAFHKCLSDDWRETKAVLVTSVSSDFLMGSWVKTLLAEFLLAKIHSSFSVFRAQFISFVLIHFIHISRRIVFR